MRFAAYIVTILLLASTLAGFSSGTSSSPAQIVTSYSSLEVPISTVTWTSTVGQALVSDSFTVSPPSGSNGCNIVDYKFTPLSGTISVTMTASSPVDFYLVSSGAYNQWVSGNRVSCDGPSNYLKDRPGMTSYEFTANLQGAILGDWVLVFINFSKSSTANVAITVNSVGSLVTYTRTSDSLYIQTILVTKGTSGLPSQQQLPAILMLGIVAIIVVAFGAIAVRKRRKTETHSVSKTAKPAVVAPDKMFCRKCGRQIPRDSIFCPECGKKF